MRWKCRRPPAFVERLCCCSLILSLVFVGVSLGDPTNVSDSQAGKAVPYSQSFNARLRHQRHLLDKTPHSESLISSDDSSMNPIRGTPSKIGLTVQDNHKPVFTNCSNYQPTVKEEQPTNTYVFTVKAVDKDPPDNGGTITYTFVSAPGERSKFSVDAQTGVITTRYMFDRDEPTREKEVYLTVRATDNGKPHLDDVCTIKVSIQDENDNSPVFDKVNYVESVPQDSPLGNEVMRISATDIDDGLNSAIQYDLTSRRPQDSNYFRIDQNTGVIYLDRLIDKDPNHKFQMRATANDQGAVPKSATMDLEIMVVESNKKAPTFISVEPEGTINLPENLTNFSYNIATIKAESNTDEKAPVFELVPGRTEQTNKLNTFRLESEGNTAHIRLSRALDYESISEYTLNIRIQNKHSLAAEHQLNIQLEDVNDNIPVFTEVVSGSVLENEPAGTPVMQVRAIDADSSATFNHVTYELADNQGFFAIDRYTGNITTLVTFDREKQDIYNVKVIATDNAPSALYSTGANNKGEQVFRIEIADKNDHSPRFTQLEYEAEEIPEDANLNAIVTEVKALDNDTASSVTYSILDGNIYNAFLIESTTGKIKVNNKLDYENITDYVLKVRAFDGAFEDFCTVKIKISNVNDNPPIFREFDKKITIEEEQIVKGCITTLEAYDPDIQDRSADQQIVYSVVKDDQRKLMTIDKKGCLYLIKPLDRDPPNGYATWQVIVQANDESGGPKSLKITAEVIITLNDINDNAPFLDMPQPVVWRENQSPGIITRLTAKDNDGPENGGPFDFKIASDALYEIQTKFGISGIELQALTTFDREEKKVYNIPITITDNGIPTMTGTSTLQVVIGDENDNPMKPGKSSIFVYTYKGESPDMEIGRVYVDDLDDWDLPDKKFKWLNGSPHERFDLKSDTGMITMLQNTKEQTYVLEFEITEQGQKIGKHTVNSTVVVTVKEIPEEAVDKSGSVRLAGISAEDFITPGPDNKSKATILKHRLASILNTSVENVDVFTVLHSPHNPNTTQLDVRFSAHGSPYYQPEKINAAIDKYQSELEKELGVVFLMVNIDECLVEKLYCESSCTNFLSKSNRPAAVYTNTTSFVGIQAVIDPFCQCEQTITNTITCHNGGTPTSDGTGCICPPGFERPRCEILSIGFYGEGGYALYPSLQSCKESHMSLEVRTSIDNGLLFYAGPSSYKPSPLSVQDFMSLELINGFPVLLVDYGSGTLKIEQKQIKISNGEQHHIEIIWTKTSIEMKVDSCIYSSCLSLSPPIGPNEYLNVNGPLQLGGSFVDLSRVAATRNWTHKPLNNEFNGCIRNLTFNGRLYNLGAPSLSHNVDFSCQRGTAVAVSFGIDASFLIAIFVCLAVLLILLLAVVVHRRKSDDLYKDTDDIRENIINYEDEGGGEGDMTGYDLNVLRLMYDGSEPVQGFDDSNILLQKRAPDEVPDICGFLGDKLNAVDNDPDLGPYDDVRNYMYEGEGNSVGSLSSLASGTDDGDLNFDYLSNFGPRFRKLADMYGEDPSDEESETYRNAHPESWC